ncbi:chitin synthesis regulation, resistance to congo red-domain-containing protein [Lophiotrema nucula]|uniref:Chitin synthesis regulation, resistance to congo red-domain-containing protein n=1 Tax=Lophiotrema nucula TaxID=690887 RepID=A0A6A5ZA01_9PLEO|nr:chitin synthesis regulation, resistance to congo red-domain-containing protein [Lophiotrema nucula]
MPALVQARAVYGDCYYENGIRYCRRSAWNDWVRWLVLVLVVLGFFLLFVVCSCITARRRRKAGSAPYYGTGWMARPGQHNQSAQPYYNNKGVELQQPQPAYNRGDADNVYAPPAGPPPGKH